MSKRIYTSRRQYTIETSRPYMPLEDIWPYAHRNGIVFCYRYDGEIDVFSFGRKLSMPFKRGVHKNRARLLQMMRSYDWRCCPARDAGHWKHWVYYPRENKHVCLLCEAIGA